MPYTLNALQYSNQAISSNLNCYLLFVVGYLHVYLIQFLEVPLPQQKIEFQLTPFQPVFKFLQSPSVSS